MSGNDEASIQSILTDDEPDEAEYIDAWEKSEGDDEKRLALAKSAPNGSVSKMEFEITSTGSVDVLRKAEDDFVIWGPASVEVVDKERDRITAEALEKALPQLLKRSRLSYEHADQIVGDIHEKFSTDEPVTVEIDGKSYERTEFPTDVLKLDGMPPALYVAGEIYDDTEKSRQVRKQIESGELDSYSISGEAIVTEMAVKDGQSFTDILKLDLSAVTVCKEGMNQKAEFDVVTPGSAAEKSALTPGRAASLAKSRINETMRNDNDDDDVQKFVDALDKTLEERLPEGDLATKEDVEDIVDDRMKAQEDSPTEGTPDRPSGENPSGSAVEEDPEYEGDQTVNPADEGDKVEEKGGKGADNHMTTKPENFDEVEDDEPDEKAYSTDELKSILPDDQYKAIAPLLEEKAGEEDFLPADDDQPEEVVDDPAMPDDEPEMPDEEGEADPVLASGDRAKSAGDLEWGRLTEDQKKALAKSGALQKTEGNVRTSPSVASPSEPAHAGSSEGSDVIAKADNESVSSDPAMRNIYGDDGTPQI